MGRVHQRTKAGPRPNGGRPLCPLIQFSLHRMQKYSQQIWYNSRCTREIRNTNDFTMMVRVTVRSNVLSKSENKINKNFVSGAQACLCPWKYQDNSFRYWMLLQMTLYINWHLSAFNFSTLYLTTNLYILRNPFDYSAREWFATHIIPKSKYLFTGTPSSCQLTRQLL